MARLTKFNQLERGRSTEIVYDDGRKLLYSYETLVAGEQPQLGYMKTRKTYSVSTTKHIRNYFINVPSSEVKEVSEDVLESLTCDVDFQTQRRWERVVGNPPYAVKN